MEVTMNKLKFGLKILFFSCLFLTTANLFGMYSGPTKYTPYVPTSDYIMSLLTKSNDLEIQNDDLKTINKIINLYCNMCPEDSNEAIATKIIGKINHCIKSGITNYEDMLSIMMISSAIIEQLELTLDEKIEENDNIEKIINDYLKACPCDSRNEIASKINNHIKETKTDQPYPNLNLTGVLGIIRRNLVVYQREREEAAITIQRCFRKYLQKKKENNDLETQKENDDLIFEMDDSEEIDGGEKTSFNPDKTFTPYMLSMPTTPTTRQKHPKNTYDNETTDFEPAIGKPQNSYMETNVATPKRINHFVLGELKESVYKTPPSSPRPKNTEDEEDHPMSLLFED